VKLLEKFCILEIYQRLRDWAYVILITVVGNIHQFSAKNGYFLEKQ
jgi:hypothetical protein